MKVSLENSRPLALVLDLQALFTSAAGPFPNVASGDLIENVNGFLSALREKQVPIVFSSYKLADDLSDAGLLKENPIVKKGYFSAGSSWMKWDKRLRMQGPDILISRNRPSAFFGGGLAELLDTLHTDALLLCGLSVNNAVSSTARDAFALDIPTLVVKDCTGAAPWEQHMDLYFEILDDWTAEVLTSAELLERI